MKIKIFKTKYKRGFIILFAVTLSAILLSIALGVANVSFKEVSFSTSARDSNDAFLAADAASECALYHDKLSSTKFPLPSQSLPITCGATTTTPTFSGSATAGTYSFVLTGLGNSNSACAKVSVFKDKSVTPNTVVITTTGYNMGDATCSSTNTRRVERELVVSSYVGATPVYTPPASTVDIRCNGGDSCSIAYNGTATLSWSTSSSVTSCTAVTNGAWTGSKTWPTGNQNISSLTSTQTYTINCSGASGSTSDSVVVTVGSPPTPIVVTNAATSVTGNSATLNGSANPNGFASTGYFRYSTTNPGTCNDTFGTRSPSTGGTNLGSGTSSVAYSSSVSGLSANTTYYYCAIASNANGIGYGAVSSFATSISCSYTGGSISDSGGYRYHTFTSSGSFISNCSKAVDYLVVGGGGGGGGGFEGTYGGFSYGGGGGAGGVLNSSTTLPANTYAITVGTGGGSNVSGANSSISGIATAIGGGRGGHGGNDIGYPDTGASGGSGGGGGSGWTYSQPAGGSGTAGQGYAGGRGEGGIWNGGAGGGGGAAGAGGAGYPGPSEEDRGHGAGGSGVYIWGSYYSFGGNGAGGSTYGYLGSGGGGGAGFWLNASAGRPGVVIIRYVYP